MKKIISSILIAIVVLQLFAPFSVGWGNKKFVVEKNIANAANELALPQFQENTNTSTDVPAFKTTIPKGPADTVDEAIANGDFDKKTGTLPVCGIMPPNAGSKIMGCLAQGLYYIFFVPTSAIFALTGKALDISLMFSISDASYRSSFVTEGWGIVRDFCNMFFIFVMLYIAIGTILNLSGVKTKEMIVNVVIIGLLINFSLLATQIIIDTSNILTRVFYNTNTIATGAATKDANGNIISVDGSLGDFGEIKLSEAIITKVDPQKLILEAQKVSALPIRGQANNEDQTPTSQGISTGSFILITILATAVNIFGIIAFFSCAIIFVARVVGLWMAMILAPIAFFSYTVPALQNIESIGWKHWWTETLNLAFLAPIFAFFMYIIVAFLGKGLDLINADGKTGLSFVVAIVVPFVFIMVLLTKAKDMTKKMSGEIGKTMTKVGESVGKLAVGAVGGLATGGASLALRGTLGAAGSAMKNSKWAQNMAGSDNKFASFIGNKSMDVGGKIGSSTFDVRNTKLGASAISKAGLNMGKASKAAEGGFDGAKKRQIEKAQKRAKELEPGQSSKEKQDLNKAQETLKDLENKHNRDAEPQEAKVNIAQQNWSNANSALLADKNDPAKIAAEAAAKKNLDKEKAALFAIKNGGLDPNTGQYRTTNGNISQAAIDGAAKDLVTADSELTGATQAYTTALQAKQTALINKNTAINSVQQAQTDLQNAQIAAAAAATIAAAPGATTADAINHTNALSIQAAAQAKMDKINSDVQTTTNAYNNADSNEKALDSKLTAAIDKQVHADQANTDAINAQTLAMANGGIGESINEIKFGSLKAAQNAYDIKANSNKNNFANNTQFTGSNIMSKIFNYTVNGGVYSASGADEAAHNIRMDVKTDK